MQRIVLLIFLILLLSCSAFLINYQAYHFPGNNYFPAHVLSMAVILAIFYLGLTLFFGPDSKISERGMELLYLFGLMWLIALATNAIQLTPFNPIDSKLIAVEETLHINMATTLYWINSHPTILQLLQFLYDSLAYQMIAFPLLLIVFGKFRRLHAYYFLLLFTTLIGFSFYYFFPTTAPASLINSIFFSSSQYATALKFKQIHHYISPTTIEGGLIALPSFHTVWALLCVYLLQDWAIPCCILLLINSILIASCFLLGWHYFIDILGGIGLVLMGIYALPKALTMPDGWASSFKTKGFGL